MSVEPQIGSGNLTVDIVYSGIRDTAGNTLTVPNQIIVPYVRTQSIADSKLVLGSKGSLIYPVQISGKKYYYWDLSNDGTSSGDTITHDSLDSIFRYDQSGNLNPGTRTNDVYRYATIGGVKLALPTHGGTSSGVGTSRVATDAGASTYKLDAGGYQELLEIWDLYNTPFSGANKSGVNGTPSGWFSGPYWSSTPSYLAPQTQYANVFLNLGGVGSWLTSNSNNVALEVVSVSGDAIHPSITSVSFGGTDSIGQIKSTTLTVGDKVEVSIDFRTRHR